MKPQSFILGVSLLGLIALGGGHLLASTEEMPLETIAVFDGANGSYPQSISETEDGTIFGVTYGGGAYDKGTIFVVHMHEPLTTLYSFKGTDGSHPLSGLTMGADRTYYGTTSDGGSHDLGTIFHLTAQGKEETLLSFNRANGANPQSRLLAMPNGLIYGCTETGGDNDLGTLFVIDREHQVKTLVSFNGLNGAHPSGLVPGQHGELYGTTNRGGTDDKGTLFKLNSDGSVETVHSFHESEGAYPQSLILEQSGIMVGTTSSGGKHGLGTFYSITPEGVLTDIKDFDETHGSNPISHLVEWSDGYFYMTTLNNNMRIKARMIQWLGVNFCGITSTGGTSGKGTVYRINMDGMMDVLASFSGTEGPHVGSSPTCLVPGQDGDLYGVTEAGGSNNKGTIFRLAVHDWMPPLTADTMKHVIGDFSSPPIVSP